jgi:hypothetical protein
MGKWNQNDVALLEGDGGPKQEAESPKFPDSRKMKVVRLSALRTDRTLSSLKYSRYSFLRGWIDPSVTVQPEGLCQ